MDGVDFIPYDKKATEAFFKRKAQEAEKEAQKEKAKSKGKK